MMRVEREQEFLRWFKSELLTPKGELINPRLSAMREAGGVDYREAEAQSIAWQVEFANIEAAKEWSARHFAGIAARFEEHFGPDAMVFTSYFEQIEWPI